ncbi:MAG: hypothetical protein Q9157_000344 [Trypethelium eluteriae]
MSFFGSGNESTELANRARSADKARDKVEVNNGGLANVLEPQAAQNEENGYEKVTIEGMLEPHSDGDKSTENPSRFIGDMTPESVLRGRMQERGIGGPSQSQIGYFISAKEKEPETVKQTETQGIPNIIVSGGIDQQRKLRIQIALESYLQALGVSVLPSDADTEALMDIYFSSVQPLLPIIHKDGFKAAYKDGTVSKTLLQAVCLVASRHNTARPHLRLQDEAAILLEPKQFADRLYSSIVASLNAHLETDKLVLIQVNALLSINREVSAEHDDNSVHLAKAIQYAHSIGLHLGRARKELRDERLEKLFWCLWGLDKLTNGSINARPTQLKEADIGLTNMMDMKKYRHTAFGMWLRLCTYLENIISFYRPSADPASTGWEEDFPAFEDIVGTGGDKLQNEVITLLELLYHCVAMLSCRSRSMERPARSTPSYVRASLSAVRVISIMESPSARNLPPLPVPDWSVALSMSFAYRQYRQSKLSMHQARAKEDLEKCCNILEGLKTVWHSAGVVAEMGRAVISRANKVSRALDDRPRANGQGRAAERSKHRSQASYDSPPSRNNLPRSGSEKNSLEQDPKDPFHVYSPTELSGQQPISSAGGEHVAQDASRLTPSASNTSYDGAFDNIDAVLGSYPDLNFPLDFTDALASLNDQDMHAGSNEFFLG